VALALVILGFVPGAYDAFNAPKALALRVLGGGLLAALAVAALAGRRLSMPAASGVGPFERTPLSPVRLLDLAVLGWLAVGGLSLLAGVAPRLALAGELTQREGLLTTLALAGLYFAARRGHATAEEAVRTNTVALTCAGIAAVHALLQVAGLDPLGGDTRARYVAGAVAVTRPAATLGNPILLGLLLAGALGIAAVRLARPRATIWREGALVVLLATACIATLSRGAWLAALAAVAVVLAEVLARRGATRARVAARVLALAVAVPAAWALVALRAPLLSRVHESAHPGAGSLAARIEIARSALALWREHPWLGSGPDTFGFMFPSVQTAALWRTDWAGVPVHAHSAWLQILATLGVAGVAAALLVLASFAWVLAGAWRSADERAALGRDGAAMLVALSVGGAVNPIGLAGVTLLTVVAGALAGALAGPRAPAPARGSSLALAAGAVVAVVIGVGAVRELRGLAAAGEARDALVRASDRPGSVGAAALAHAADRACDAASRVRESDELWRLASDAALAAARAHLAAADSARARGLAGAATYEALVADRIQPGRGSNALRFAESAALQSRLMPPALAPRYVTESDSAFAAAIRLAPRDALVLTAWTRAALESGRPEVALTAARRAVALYPGAGPAHALEAAACLAAGDRAGTLVALRHARAAYWEADTEREHAAVERLYRALTGGAAD
jgi:O-antigen ligase